MSGGYDTNPARTNAGGGASVFGIVAPALQVNSNWSRHELTADLRGSYTSYGAAPGQDRPAFDGKIDGRIDVTSRTASISKAAFWSPPTIPAARTSRPASPICRSPPTSAAPSGSVSASTGSTSPSRADRPHHLPELGFHQRYHRQQRRPQFDQYSTQLRTAYELTPGVQPFVEIDADRRHHDLPLDQFGIDRDSDGRAAKVGRPSSSRACSPAHWHSATCSATTPIRRCRPSRARRRRLTLLGGERAHDLQATAVTRADKSTLAGVSGAFTHEVGVEVDHAFRTWLDGTLKFTGDRDSYVGSARQDDRYAGSFALTYKLTRELQLKGELRREWLNSNTAGNNYQAYVALLGVRLQR